MTSPPPKRAADATPFSLLTPGQQRALTLDRHLSVTANAGSGKTLVLVERYLEILIRTDAMPADLVALTYTDKAAGELKRKIAERVRRELDLTADPARRARLESVREQLPAAIIGTIHAFCSRILREHPVEAGVDAAFAVIEGLDQMSLLQEAVRGAFASVLKPGTGGDQRARLVGALRRTGRWMLVNLVEALVEKRELMSRLTSAGGPYGGSDTDLLQRWDAEVRGILEKTFGSPRFIADVDRVVGAGRGNAAAGAAALLRQWKEGTDTRQRARILQELFGILWTQKGEFSKKFAGPGTETALVREESARLLMLRSSLNPLLQSLTDPGAEGRHRALIEIARCALAVAGEAVRRYAAAKTENGQLDFEDLQVLMKRLLGDEEIRARLARRFRFIMVDEYQDTNSLQYDILAPLVGGLASGNLFIVGDPKQSIYAFRDADVAVFTRTRSDILGVSGHEGAVALEESFRPLQDLVAFVNLVFSHVMAPDETAPEEVRYEPLVRARPNESPGSVEIILADDEEDQGASEGDLIARRIQRLVAERHQVFGRGEAPRDARYQDIAVLLRSRTPLADIEEALIRAHVPYVVSAGVGYFQTQDVFDVYNYLQFLLNPSDDVALSGILRSPFFAVSDADLLNAAWRRGGSLWQQLDRTRTAGGLSPSLREAVDALREDLRDGLRMPAPQLIDHILSRSAYAAKVVGTVRGEQAVANLDKLQRMARSFEAQGFAHVYDFVARLRRLIGEEEREGQGEIESRGDAVQVMTVHAAKGLEFPVVIVPVLDKGFRYDSEPFVDAQLGIGLSFSGPQDPEGTRIPLTEHLRLKSARRTEAEEKRILYVALTRARDMLILSGGNAGRRASWMKWIVGALERVVPVQRGEQRVQVKTDVLITEGRAYRRERREHSLRIRFLTARDLPEVKAGAGQSAPRRELPGLLVQPVVPGAEGEVYSATKIRTYKECPSKYYLRYVLGLPFGVGTPARTVEPVEEPDRDFPAELRGRVFHAVMQRIDRLGSDRQEIGRAVRDALLFEVPTGGASHEMLAREVEESVMKLLGSAAWQRFASGSEVRTEYTITAALGQDFLSGTIDRLLRDREGVLTLLDYKTDAVRPDTVRTAAGVYWPQLEFYAVLVSRFFSAPAVRIMLLFTTLPDENFERILTAPELAGLEAEVLRVISQIRAGNFESPPVPCAGCPFAPAGCADFLRHVATPPVA